MQIAKNHFKAFTAPVNLRDLYPQRAMCYQDATIFQI